MRTRAFRGGSSHFNFDIIDHGWAQVGNFIKVLRNDERSQVPPGTASCPPSFLISEARVLFACPARGRKAALCITVAANLICQARAQAL